MPFRNGAIWLKSAADKRRVNSKEELRRLFQSVDQFHADELPTKAGIDKLDRLRFRGIHVKRDTQLSIAYSKELIFSMSVTLQSTDRHHGIVGQERCHFQRDS